MAAFQSATLDPLRLSRFDVLLKGVGWSVSVGPCQFGQHCPVLVAVKQVDQIAEELNDNQNHDAQQKGQPPGS
jgi:hypothetical protein